jgi:hypothetical protein
MIATWHDPGETMNRLIRNALIAALSLALNPTFAQSDLGSPSRGQAVHVLPDSAAGRVVATVYEGRFAWVRIETREDGAAANQHPFDVAPTSLRAMLERVQLVDAKPAQLFTAKQLDEIVAPLATALGRANAGQDISLAVSDQFGFLGPLASRAVTTARIFHRDGQLHLIAGLVRRDFESQFRGSGILIAFEPGQRAKPVERGVKLAVAPGKGSQQRDDWIVLSTSVATPVPGAALPTAIPNAATPIATPAAAAGGTGAASAARPSAPATPPAPAAKEADELYRSAAERLRTLEKLRKDGLISEAEYQEKRRQILREL